MLEMVYDQTTINAFKFIGLKHNLTISYMKLVIEFLAVDGVEHLSSIVKTGLVDLQNFMFSDRYHLTISALARVCPSMTSFMLWITSFNRCRMFLLLLLLNALLKARAVYFKADSTISGTFQCSACSAGAPPTCTSSTINLGVDGPFSN